jgi:hypothetical protein
MEVFRPSTGKNVAQCPVNRFKLLGGDRFHISREDYRMMRTVFLGVALAFGLATAAGAAVTPAQVGNAASLVIKAAEGCGPGFWRGPPIIEDGWRWEDCWRWTVCRSEIGQRDIFSA